MALPGFCRRHFSGVCAVGSCQATWFYTELKPIPALPDSVGRDCSPGSEDLGAALLASLCVFQIAESCTGIQTYLDVEVLVHVSSPHAQLPLQGKRQVLF